MMIDMRYFKKLSILLIALMILGTFSGIYATNTNIDNNNPLIDTKQVSKTITSTTNKTKTIYVDTNGNNKNNGLSTKKPKKTIQNAIKTAKPGDTIQVAKGTYKENLQITKNIILKGDMQSNTIIDAAQKQCVNIRKGVAVTIAKFTLKNGNT
ncbi:MAG: pectinesterase family protein [Methanobacterium sp.]|nr:pectinesterase family protein [Methanobacterium sp.]